MATCPHIKEIPLQDCQALGPHGDYDVDQGIFEVKKDDKYSAHSCLVADNSTIMDDEEFDKFFDDDAIGFLLESQSMNDTSDLPGFYDDIDLWEEEGDRFIANWPRRTNVIAAGMENYSQTISVCNHRVRHRNKICGIVYKEIPKNTASVEKPKPKPWAYYVTDSDIINFIAYCNVNLKWNINTFVLRDLHKDFKVAKKVLYHATMEDAIRTKEKFISCLEATLENRATQEQRAFLLSNSKTKYQEGIVDSKLSHFDYRLKVFMEVLRDPQQQEALLLKAKEFIRNPKKNRKSPRVNMETDEPPTNDVAPRRKRTNSAIRFVRISRSSPSCQEDVFGLLWSARSVASVLFNLTLLCAVWGSFVMYSSG